MAAHQPDSKRDYKSQVLHDRIHSATNSAKHLMRVFQQQVKHERQTAVKGDKLAHEIRQAGQQENFEQMQVMLNALANVMENEQNIRRQIMGQRYEELILSHLKHYETICFQPANKMLKDRDETMNQYIKAETEVKDLHSKNKIHTKKYTKALEEQRVKEQRHNNVDFMLNENAQLYEYQRLKDMKDMMTEYVHGYMAFHCRALENLSRVAEVLHKVDPQEGMDDMRDVLEGTKHSYTASEMATKAQKEADKLTSDLPASAYRQSGGSSSHQRQRRRSVDSQQGERHGYQDSNEGEHEEGTSVHKEAGGRDRSGSATSERTNE